MITEKRLHQAFGLLTTVTFIISLIFMNDVGGWKSGVRIAVWILLFTTFSLDCWKYFGIDCMIFLGYSTWMWYDYGKRIGILLAFFDFSWTLSKWWCDCLRARQENRSVVPLGEFEMRRKISIKLTSIEVHDQDWVCTICMDEDNKENVAKASCGHPFHQACIVKWVHSKAICPLCRADIRSVSTTTSEE